MEPAFEVRLDAARAQTVRSWGYAFVAAVERDEPMLEQRLSQLGGLSRSESAELGESVATLCRASVRGVSFETARRMQLYGARVVAQCGLAFSDDLLGGDIAPSLLRVVLEPGDSRFFSKGAVQLAAVQALTQVAPRLSEEISQQICATILSYALTRTDVNGFAEVLALSKFENLYRHDPFGVRHQTCSDGFRLSLRVIERMLRISVEALADASTEEECLRAIDSLDLVRLAGGAWLTLLPAIAASSDPEVQELMATIVEHAEWMVNRPYGFPGFFYGEASVRDFEAARSALSLSLGVISLLDSRYDRLVSDLSLNPAWLAKVPETIGNTLLRSVITAGPDLVRERYRASLPLYLDSVGRAGLRAEGPDTVEAAALAWHLGCVEPIVLVDTLEHVYQPGAQYYLTKAICHPSPWS